MRPSRLLGALQAYLPFRSPWRLAVRWLGLLLDTARRFKR